MHLSSVIPAKRVRTPKFSSPRAGIEPGTSSTRGKCLTTRKSNDPDVKNHYKRFRAHVQKVERDAYWKHVSNIFTFENDPSDPDSNKSGKSRSFGHLSNHLRKTRLGSHHLGKTEF